MEDQNTVTGTETPEKTNDTHAEDNAPILTGPKATLGLILVCLAAGMVGGVYGALNLSNRPAIQRLFNGGNAVGGTIGQSIVLTEESAITKVVEETSPAVVSIIVSKELRSSRDVFDPFGFFTPTQQEQDGIVQQVGAGTGFFVSEDGLLLTNRHVVNDPAASYTVLTNDGKSYEARVLSRDPVNDLAIVKVDGVGFKYLTFADSSKIEPGQHVVAIGNSLGQYQNTVTSGIVSGIGRSIVAGDRTGSEQLEGVIQTDAAINPGNSGGPLLNLAGQVIGINTAVDQQGQSVGFAIASNDVKSALESYQASGKIVRPQMGVRYITITEAIAEREGLPRTSGALVVDGGRSGDPAVLPGSPAEKAGIRSNDIIISINNQQLDDDTTLSKALKSYKPGDTITIKVLRGGNELSLPVTLGEAQ
jgi:serine protease Do